MKLLAKWCKRSIAIFLAAAQGQVFCAGLDYHYVRATDEASLSAIAKSVLGRGRSFAVLIGISQYLPTDAGGFSSLDGASKDAERMKSFLQEAGFDEIFVITEDKATKARIERLMEDELPSRLRSQDRLLFYWSGHGIGRALDKNKTIGYLPLQQSKRTAFSSMVSMEDFARWDRLLVAKQTLFIVDACLSGLAGIQSKSDIKSLEIEQLDRTSHHLLAAGTATEEAVIGARWGGSLFTDTIIRGASGAAGSLKSPVISLSDLLVYVRRQVAYEKDVARWDKSITPQLRQLQPSDGEFYFVRPSRSVSLKQDESKAPLRPKGLDEQDANAPRHRQSNALNLTLAPFKGESLQNARVSAIIKSDLERTGIIKVSEDIEQDVSERDTPPVGLFKNNNRFAIRGSLSPTDDGRVDVRFRIWESGSPTDQGQAFTVQAIDLRLVAHRIADFVYTKVTRRPSVFSTRLAVVLKKAVNQYVLMITDADVGNSQEALLSPKPIENVAWARDGKYITYVSYENGLPDLIAHELATGKRKLIKRFKTPTRGVSVSPWGLRVVYARPDEAGKWQIYRSSLEGTQEQRISDGGSSDSQPVYSPDGEAVYFVRRGDDGNSRVFRMKDDGSGVVPAIAAWELGEEPALNQDGYAVAYNGPVSGRRLVRILDVTSGSLSDIRDATPVGPPSFSPNGEMIAFPEAYGDQQVLAFASVSGDVVWRSQVKEGVPIYVAWGPMRR